MLYLEEKLSVDFIQNAKTLAALNFRALLDHYQGFVSLSVNLSVNPKLPAGHTYPIRHPLDKSASLDWRLELDRFEDAKYEESKARTNSSKWSASDSLQARTYRARELIASSSKPEVRQLLQSDAVIRLLAERDSFIRVFGNTYAHHIAEQRPVLQDMVRDCVDQLEPYEVQGLLFMIEVLRPETV